MDYIRGLEAYQDSREAAITLGKFDGVHRGHQKLIKKVCQLKAGMPVFRRCHKYVGRGFHQEDPD